MVDDDGNKVAIDTNTNAGKLLALFDYLIFGTGTTGGVLDIEFVLGAFEEFAGPRTPANAMHAQIDKLRAFAEDMLRLNGSHPIDFLAWHHLIQHHQEETYLDYFRDPSEKNGKAAEEGMLEMIDGGRQLAFFFATFYSGVAILDIFMDTVLMDTTPSVFSPGLLDFRVDLLHMRNRAILQKI